MLMVSKSNFSRWARKLAVCSNGIVATMALMTISMSAVAQEQRPRIVHGDSISCVYIYSGNAIYETCDKSVAPIQAKYDEENRRIDSIIAREARDKKEQQDRYRASADAAKEFDVKAEKELFAKNPRGYACVKKRLRPGVVLWEASDADMQACGKEFNSKKR